MAHLLAHFPNELLLFFAVVDVQSWGGAALEGNAEVFIEVSLIFFLEKSFHLRKAVQLSAGTADDLASER